MAAWFGCGSLALELVCYGDQDGFLVGMTTEGGYVLDGQLQTLGLVTPTSFVGTNFECGLGEQPCVWEVVVHTNLEGTPS